MSASRALSHSSRRLSRRLSEPVMPYEEVDHVGAEISLFRHPVKTLHLFGTVVAEQTAVAWRWVRTRALLPACAYACFRVAARRLGWNAYGYLAQVEHVAWFVSWWLGLGVLSSIGLGSGLHSGILFLFPHIAKARNPHHAALAQRMCSTSDVSLYARCLGLSLRRDVRALALR